MAIKINKWESFQSYKDRRPPWIRLHKTILDDFEFHAMSEKAQALTFMLWLLASEDADPTSGLIQYSYDQIAFRLRRKEADVKKACEEIAKHGFIQLNWGCNDSVTDSLQNDNKSVPSETEAVQRRAEAEAENRRSALVQDIKMKWNKTAVECKISKIKDVSDPRMKGYKLRCKEAGGVDEFWRIVETELPLLDEKPRMEWVKFPWLVKSGENFLKFSEGNYRIPTPKVIIEDF